MGKKLIEIAAEIVQNQASLTRMSATEITLSLKEVFNVLQDLQRAEREAVDLCATEEPAPSRKEPARSLTSADSIQENRVVCLECGAEMRQLTASHLATHGLTAREYKKKHGFPLKASLAAKSLTKVKKKAGRKRGLPGKLKEFLEAKRKDKSRGAGTESG